jgi:protein-disulfide isomerase
VNIIPIIITMTIKEINMKFLTILVLTILLTATNSFATSPAATATTPAVADPHAGHDHGGPKDPKERLKSEVEAYEEYKRKVKEFESSDKFTKGLLTEKLPLDVNFGDPNAPIKIVEYASLSCIHCKQFHKDVFYEVKKNYIDTGKVYFTYRHYPLNSPAVKGAVVLDCIKDENKLSFIGALFEAQAEWAYTKSEADLKDKLSTISKIAGLSQEEFDVCYMDDKKQETVLQNMKRAFEGLGIDSTPAIFVQGSRYVGSRVYEGFAQYIDDVIAGKDPTKAPLVPVAPTPPAKEAPKAEPAKTEPVAEPVKEEAPKAEEKK